MDDEPLSSEALSALEACRPGRHDEALPEVAERLAHLPPAQVSAARRSLQRVDRAITTAMRQVPVPVGLAERLLERLAAAERNSQNPAVAGDTDIIHAAGDIAPDAPGKVAAGALGDVAPADEAARHVPRRAKWLVASGMLALAASLLIALVVWPRERMQLADMQTEVRAFYEADNHSASSVPSQATRPALGGVSSEWVVGGHAINLFDRSGYAYELAHRRARGTLYVVPLKSWRGPALIGLSTAAFAQSTSGTTVAAWTDNTNAYFLVAKGDSRALAVFLRRSIA